MEGEKFPRNEIQIGRKRSLQASRHHQPRRSPSQRQPRQSGLPRGKGREIADCEIQENQGY